MKYLKEELRFILDHIAIVILAAFIGATGGVLVWINGGSTWYLIRTGCGAVPQMSIVFSVWVITYGLMGAAMALIWLIYREQRCDFGRTFTCFSLCALSYLFMLVWYALFFCTRLVVFAGIILILSCVTDGLLFWFMRKTLVTFQAVMAVAVVIQAYFIWFTFCFF